MRGVAIVTQSVTHSGGGRPEHEVGRNKSSQFRHKPHVTQLPELRKTLFRPTTHRGSGRQSMELEWVTNHLASCCHAAEGITRGLPPADARLGEPFVEA